VVLAIEHFSHAQQGARSRTNLLGSLAVLAAERDLVGREPIRLLTDLLHLSSFIAVFASDVLVLAAHSISQPDF
jgi:hypothetical protein